MLVANFAYGIGHLVTDKNGSPAAGVFVISSSFWFTPVAMLLMFRIRRILSRMDPSDITSYISNDTLVVGTSSLVPMMYLGLDTLKCLLIISDEVDCKIASPVYNACGQVRSHFSKPFYHSFH